LAEPRRVAILKLLGSRELRAGEISRPFRTTPAISQHLEEAKPMAQMKHQIVIEANRMALHDGQRMGRHANRLCFEGRLGKNHTALRARRLESGDGLFRELQHDLG
jgi:DNA-binding transcriptional ArsR family regulator